MHWKCHPFVEPCKRDFQRMASMLQSTAYSTSLLVGLKQLYDQGQLCDFCLVTGDAEIRVHSAVLFSASKYFKALMDGGTLRQPRFFVSTTNSETLIHLVNFLYTGCLNLSHDNVYYIWSLANNFIIPEALELCQQYLANPNHDQLSLTSNAAILPTVVSDATADFDKQHQVSPPCEVPVPGSGDQVEQVKKRCRIEENIQNVNAKSQSGLSTGESSSQQADFSNLPVIKQEMPDAGFEQAESNSQHGDTHDTGWHEMQVECTQETSTKQRTKQTDSPTFTSLLKKIVGINSNAVENEQSTDLSKSRKSRKSTKPNKKAQKSKSAKVSTNNEDTEDQKFNIPFTGGQDYNYESNESDYDHFGVFDDTSDPMYTPSTCSTKKSRKKSRLSGNSTTTTFEMGCEDITVQERPWQCFEPDCTFLGTSKTQLIKHVNMLHPAAEHYCPGCRYRTKVQVLMDIHQANKNHYVFTRRTKNVKKNICDVCGASFSRPGKLKVHKLRKHQVQDPTLKVLQCPLEGCTYDTVHQYLLRQHMKMHEPMLKKSTKFKSGPKTHACGICGSAFSWYSLLAAHRKSHFAVQVGHIRAKQVISRALVCSSKSIHKSETDFNCNKCHKNWTQKCRFQAHMTKKHSPKHHYRKCYTCSSQNIYRSRNQLMCHRVHHHPHLFNFPAHKVRLPRCEHCERQFIHESNLEKHVETTHQNPESASNSGYWRCLEEECNFIAAGRGFLMKHVLKDHPGTKYHCQCCTYRTNVKLFLNIHQATSSHYGTAKVKNNICDLCGSRFSRPGKLKIHKLHKHHVHDPSLRLYQCPEPGCRFLDVYKYLITRHQKAHHSGITFRPSIVKSRPKIRKCDICSSTFSWYSSLSAHKKTHFKSDVIRSQAKDFLSKAIRSSTNVLPPTETSQTDYKCDRCDKSCATRSQFNAHFRQKHHRRSQIFNCENCDSGKIFSSRKQLTFHKIQYHPNLMNAFTLKEKLLPCEDCGRKFLHEKTLQRHFKILHEKSKPSRGQNSKMWQCLEGLCTYVGPTRANLVSHVKFVHPAAQYRCRCCKYRSKVKLLLEMHQANMDHYGNALIKNKVCELCGARFTRPSKLKIHMLQKHRIQDPSVKAFQCTVKDCTYVAVYPYLLTNHMKTHLPESFICDICNKTFKAEQSRDDHIQRIHLGIKTGTHICHICGQVYRSQCELDFHILSKHTDEKTYHCEHCEYATVRRESYKYHLFQRHKIKLHENMKIFRCEECGHETCIRKDYNSHIKLHSDVRDVKCIHCDKLFKNRVNMQRHVRFAHQPKDFICQVCNFSTSLKAKLQEHTRVMHTHRNVKPYKCPYCSFQCATGGNCRKHVGNIHKGMSVEYIKLPMDSKEAATTASPTNNPTNTPANT